MKLANVEATLPLVLAPMAGITDLPFRYLCCKLGADWAVSEMLSSNPRVWGSSKSKLRMAGKTAQEIDPQLSTAVLPEQLTGEEPLRIVQIAGSDPQEMATAARFNAERGAQVIDINMGCPAKKVNKKLSGSALLREPELVKAILLAVVSAVDIPVTLKIRTGWSFEERNGVEIAQLAQQSGIAALAVHGRTRSCLFKGEAEFDTIKAIKSAVSIPVIANGDICDPKQAKWVIDYTGVDGLMIGRGAQGNPWIFREIKHYLTTGELLAAPSEEEFKEVLMEHLHLLHQFYPGVQGVRIARKHVGWYLNGSALSDLRKRFNTLETAQCQIQMLTDFFKYNSTERALLYV